MRTLRIAPRSLAALCVLALVALGLVAAGCGSSGSSTSTQSAAAAAPATIADAAYKTSAAGGAHVAITGAVTIPSSSTPLDINGSGAFDFKAHEGSLTMTISGLPAQAQSALGGSSIQLDEILRGSAIYIGSPLFAGRLPGGAKWLKIDTTQIAQGLGLDPSSLTSGGAEPGQYLQDLRAAGGHVTVVGHEEVRGVPTTRYAATIDLVKAAETLSAHGNTAQARNLATQLSAKLGFSKVPFEAWVDEKGLVRKVAVHISTHGVGASIQAEYFGFGTVPPVTVPSGSEVFEVSSQTLKGLTGAS